MEKMPLDRVRWPLLALIACACALGFAYFMEYVLHEGPCQMCWWQRYAYFTAAPIAMIAIAFNWRGAGSRLMTAFSLLLGLVFLAGFAVAVWHALYEWNLAPGPTGCDASGGALDMDRPLSEILSQPLTVASCKDPFWRIPNAPWGLSMAGLNAGLSFILMALSFFSATQPPVRTDTANEPVQA